MSTEDYIIKERSFIVDFVMWLFDDVLKYVLFTPFEFFKHPSMTNILMKMSLFSGGLVTLFAFLEGGKRILSMSYTPMRQIIMRYPLGLAVSALAPFLFYYAGMGVNELVDFMGLLTRASLEGKDHFVDMLQGISARVMESIVTFIFLVGMLIYMIRILLYHAVRWFGLFFNMVTTPIAMTAYIFKPYSHVATEWVKDTIHKFLVVVAHSFMLGLIGVLLYAPQLEFVEGLTGVFGSVVIKLMMATGGLHMMMNPPKWLQSWFDGGSYQSHAKGFAPYVRVFKALNKTIPTKGGKT